MNSWSSNLHPQPTDRSQLAGLLASQAWLALIALSSGCGGLGEYASVDPTLVRLGVLLATVFTAILPMLIVYLIAWAIVPESPQGSD